MEKAAWRASEDGTPQGATVSSLLANTDLHDVLDLGFQRWRRMHVRGDVIITRYADDFIEHRIADSGSGASSEMLGHSGLEKGRWTRTEAGPGFNVKRLRSQVMALERLLQEDDGERDSEGGVGVGPLRKADLAVEHASKR
ncbi:hypothetical protein ACLEPN_43065 [Myxococcus sp. 1LA]